MSEATEVETTTTSETVAEAPKKAKKAVKKAKPVKKVAKNAAPKTKVKKREGLSLIDAAHKALSMTTKAMNCKDLLDSIIAKKLWKPGDGLTPVASLGSRIYTEIKTKGRKARFKRAERGTFTAVKG